MDLKRDRGFESGSLLRRVGCELGSGAHNLELGTGLDIGQDRKCRSPRPSAIRMLSPEPREALDCALDVAFGQRFRARLDLDIEPPVGQTISISSSASTTTAEASAPAASSRQPAV